MKSLYFYVSVLCLHMIAYGGWADVFEQYGILLQQEACQTIKDQYDAFTQNTTPTIADHKIKMIPIFDSEETTVDLKLLNHSRIQMLPDPLTPFAGFLYNAGFCNSSKIRLSVFKKLEKMIRFIDELAPYFGFEPYHIVIKVFEGLRDLTTQKYLYDKKRNEIQEKHSELTDVELDIETAKWVSPIYNNIPVHSTGAAIDLCLFDNSVQEFIDMGIFGVIWGENKMAPTYSPDLSEQQKINRLYLQICASLAGLTNYVFEWWHFSYGDKYAAFWQEKNPELRCAVYGTIE